LTKTELILYKKNITETIVQLAKKFRAESRQLKLNMDLNGIFHPEANAHRVHCIYLMKLYKGIECSSVEEPILMSMLNEKIEKAQQDKLKEEKVNSYLESQDPNFRPITPLVSNDEFNLMTTAARKTITRNKMKANTPKQSDLKKDKQRTLSVGFDLNSLTSGDMTGKSSHSNTIPINRKSSGKHDTSSSTLGGSQGSKKQALHSIASMMRKT